MTYQIIYSSESTAPMLSAELEDLLERARTSNGIHGITGALIYVDGMFLQILEGDRASLEELMDKIRKDLRHVAVTVLREGEVPTAVFSGWKMAYASATPEQVAGWKGLRAAEGEGDRPKDIGEHLNRTAQFARDILALLTPDKP